MLEKQRSLSLVACLLIYLTTSWPLLQQFLGLPNPLSWSLAVSCVTVSCAPCWFLSPTPVHVSHAGSCLPRRFLSHLLVPVSLLFPAARMFVFIS